MVELVASLINRPCGVAQRIGPAKAATSCVVLDGKSVVELSGGTGVARVKGFRAGLCEVSPDIRTPLELSCTLLLRLQDDVRDLAREAGDPKARRFDDFDALDIRAACPLQLVDGATSAAAVTLVVDALAVDE